MLKQLIAIFTCIIIMFSNSLQVHAADINDYDNTQEETLTVDELSKNCREVTYEELCNNVLSEGVTEFKWVNGFDNFSYLSSTDFDEYDLGYTNTNCAITGVANAFAYFNANGVSMYSGAFTQAMYSNLAQKIGYISGQGTKWSTIANGVTSFASLYGRTAVFNDYWLNLWSDVTRDINANKPILLSVPVDSTNAHITLVLGYYVKDGQKILVAASGYYTPVYYEYVYSSSYNMASIYIY